MRTPMACYANTFQKGPTSQDGRPRTWQRSPIPSTPGRGKPSAGALPRKPSPNTYTHFIKPVLRPPIESAQYTSVRFGETLALSGLVPSIGSVGDAFDNALAETTIGLYKNEA